MRTAEPSRRRRSGGKAEILLRILGNLRVDAGVIRTSITPATPVAARQRLRVQHEIRPAHLRPNFSPLDEAEKPRMDTMWNFT